MRLFCSQAHSFTLNNWAKSICQKQADNTKLQHKSRASLKTFGALLVTGHIRFGTVNIVTGTLGRRFKRTQQSGLYSEPLEARKIVGEK